MKKFDSPIVLIDPIDCNRNLGTAISMDNLGKFVLASRVFLKNPSKKFFKKPVSKHIMKNIDKVVVVQFRFKGRSDDIIWGTNKTRVKCAKNSVRVGWVYCFKKFISKGRKGKCGVDIFAAC